MNCMCMCACIDIYEWESTCTVSNRVHLFLVVIISLHINIICYPILALATLFDFPGIPLPRVHLAGVASKSFFLGVPGRCRHRAYWQVESSHLRCGSYCSWHRADIQCPAEPAPNVWPGQWCIVGHCRDQARATSSTLAPRCRRGEQQRPVIKPESATCSPHWHPI